MLFYLTLIFACQLVGELVVALTGLPVPGPVVGMIVMLAALAIRRGVPADLARIAETLLGHLSLLFVPAAVGVMLHFRLIGDEWAAMGTALVVSTLLGIVVTGGLMAFALRRQNSRADGK